MSIDYRKFITLITAFFILCLCFVWPIPNDQLPFNRNGFIYPAIFFTAFLIYTSETHHEWLKKHRVKLVMISIWGLTFFILVNGFFVAPDIKEMLLYWNGQWLRPVLLFCVGVFFIGLIKSQMSFMTPEIFFTAVVLCFWGVVCVHLLDSLWLYYRDGYIHWGETRIVYNRVRMSIQINMVSGFVISELLARTFLKKKFLRLNTPFLVMMLLCNLVCTALVVTRWGTIGMIGSLFSALILIIFHGMRRNRIFMTFVFLCITIVATLLGYASWKTDSRWKDIGSDIITGWNAPFTSFCYDQNGGTIPLNRQGKPMNHSNGCRPSFFHQGWKLVFKHPAGVGPRKEAFRYVLKRDLNTQSITIPHSHYGLIEFGLQNGVTGIIGWLFLLAVCWYIGLSELRYGNTMVGLFLLLFTSSFFSRTLVDHNLKDHYLEQYMLLTGLLIGMASFCSEQDSHID